MGEREGRPYGSDPPTPFLEFLEQLSPGPNGQSDDIIKTVRVEICLEINEIKERILSNGQRRLVLNSVNGSGFCCLR
jgi:hypothetical protein